MKYPKLWNGASAVGESLVRALQRNGCKHLSAQTADGVRANTQGRFSEVKQGGEYRYFVYDIEVGRSPVLRGSWDYRTPFRVLSRHREDDVAQDWRMDTLTAGGRVFGMIDTTGNRELQTAIFAKRGRCSKTRYFLAGSNGFVEFVDGAAVGSEAHFGVAQLVDTKITPLFYGWLWSAEAVYTQLLPEVKSTVLWAVSDIHATSVGQLGHFSIHRAGPDTLYAFSVALAPAEHAHEWAAPPLMLSQDNGVTWAALAPNWPGFADGPADPYSTLGCQVNSAPGEPGTLVAIIYHNLWMGHSIAGPLGEGAAVWLVTPDGVQEKVGHTTIMSHFNADWLPGDRAPIVWDGKPVRMADSVWMLLRVRRQDLKGKIFKFSLTGELLAVFGETPVGSPYLGYPSATHDGKFMCPMYFAGDAEVAAGIYLYVFEKDDPDAPDEDGQWVRRARIKRLDSYDPTDPPIASYLSPWFKTYLPYCTQVVYANNAAGFPAPTYPAAPELGKQP
ncbi:MAG: hypothetical protein RBT67_02810 [Thauera sp.]|nr:hypothetical protein [Thauera sp.]